MPRLPRKITTASLGSFQIKWLADLARSEKDADLERVCDMALSTSPCHSTKDIASARRSIVVELNRRAGHAQPASTAKSPAQLDREIAAVVGKR